MQFREKEVPLGGFQKMEVVESWEDGMAQVSHCVFGQMICCHASPMRVERSKSMMPTSDHQGFPGRNNKRRGQVAVPGRPRYHQWVISHGGSPA